MIHHRKASDLQFLFQSVRTSIYKPRTRIISFPFTGFQATRHFFLNKEGGAKFGSSFCLKSTNTNSIREAAHHMESFRSGSGLMNRTESEKEKSSVRSLPYTGVLCVCVRMPHSKACKIIKILFELV